MSNRGIAVGQTIGDSLFVEGTSSRLCDGETAVVSDADNSISSNGKKCGTLETRTTTTLRRLGDYPEHSKRCFACKQRTLLHYRDMPPHLQFNPYIFTGYRPLLTFWGSIHSLFYLHNETINILTHGVPIVYILLTVPALIPWEQVDSRFLPWCHVAGAVSPWIGSFLYHLFMNLDRGEMIYYRLLQLDMLGIWVSQSFGALPMVTATVYCLPWVFRWVIIFFYCLLSIWGLYKAMTAWSPWERRLCFLLPFMMRVLLFILRNSSYGGGDPTGMMHVVLQDGVSAIGGMVGALHIPEKWFPGTMDFYLNSHNIMHVLVVMAVYSMHQATVRDLVWMTQVDCEARHLTLRGYQINFEL